LTSETRVELAGDIQGLLEVSISETKQILNQAKHLGNEPEIVLALEHIPKKR
jgi:hypothetical protein